MLKSGKSRLAAVFAVAAIGAGIVAAPAAAQNQQQGLVNIAIEDVIVQVPIAVAANVCDVNVAVLAQIDDEAAACEATATSMATAGPSSNGPPTRQEGLVNVLVDDVLVQAPIAIAANICDVNVAVLAEIDDAAETCVATADAAAQPGPGQGGGGGLVIDIPIHINLDNQAGTDGGATNLVSPGTDLDPLPAGLTLLQ
jgi:hypothetical protein